MGESKKINGRLGAKVIIAGSGMMSGGRIVFHAARWLPDEKTVLIITGYQAEGTLGREIVDGAKRVVILGREIEIKAGLRQPEVSVGLKSLQARGFVDGGSLKLILSVETIANMLYETKVNAAKAALEKVNGPDQVRIKLRV